MILHQTRTLDYETCKDIASHFSSRGAFSVGDSVAYRKCCKMGWLKDFFPERLSPAVPKIKGKKITFRRTLDYETCRKSALQATGRKDWDKKDCQAYNKARKMGWLKNFFPSKIVRRSEVTMEMCLEARELLRKQGKNRVSDFLFYNSNLYNMARRNGWIEQLDFQDKDVSRKEAGLRRRIYTLDYATEVAKKYNTLYDFRKNNYPLYVWCSKEGLMDNFPWLVSQRTEYTEEMIRETVAKYTDYTTFYKENPAMYGHMCRHKLLHLADSLERRVKFLDGYAVDTIYVYEIPEGNYAYVGRSVDMATRNWDHHNRKDDPLRRFAEEHGFDVPEPKILIEGITVKEGPKAEDRMIELYRSLGWNMVNSQKGGSLGGMGYNRRWTLDALYDLVSKLEYWEDLYDKYSGAWSKIKKLGIRDQFPWLKHKKEPQGKWKNMSKEEAYEIAKTFPNRQSFSANYSALYAWSYSRGWIDEWFSTATGPKRICRYTLDGQLIKIYDSIEMAAKDVGVKSPCIRGVLAGKGMTVAKSVWAYETTDVANIEFPGKDYDANRGLKMGRMYKRVNQLLENGTLIKTHDSIRAAADYVGVTPASISAVLAGKCKTIKGYKWAYADAA